MWAGESPPDELLARAGAPDGSETSGVDALGRSSIRSHDRDERAVVDRWPRRLDLIGALLYALILCWTLVAAAATGSDASPTSAIHLPCLAVYMVYRAVGRVNRIVVPLAVALAGVIILTRFWTDALYGGPYAAPFGYQNATASFFAQTAVAGLMIGVAGRSAPLRLFGFCTAGVAVLVPFVVGSVAGVMSLLVLAVTVPSLFGVWSVRRSIVVCWIVCTLVLGSTVVVASSPILATGNGGLVDEALVSKLGERRTMLWRDAFVAMVEHPILGVGPGRFWLSSDTGRRDIDARWAHNGFLQFGSETGFIGFGLLLLLLGWGFARLLGVAVPDPLTALSAASLAIVTVHASVDYVLHTPAILLAVSALAGTGVGPSDRSLMRQRDAKREAHELHA